MKPTGEMTNIAPSAGGLERDPLTLGSHTFLPGGRAAMLHQAVQVETSMRQTEDHVHVRVQVTADNVGHQVPTGFIDRHLILCVEAVDANGQVVAAEKGPLIPAIAGPSWKGKAGRLFAKYVVDSQRTGPIPFWQAAEEMVDTRLHPARPEVFVFEFAATAVQVRIQVVYRRFWESVAVEKQWPDDSILVYDETRGIGATAESPDRPER